MTRRALVLGAALLVLLGAYGAGVAFAAGSGSRGLHVKGNHIVDRHGRTVVLHGVNRSGTEYGCIQGWGIFDGPDDAASVAAMATWHVNVVRIPLNEDCWLGINGVKSEYAGARYVRAITDYVDLLHAHGMYAELSLMWGAPGTAKATYQSGAPDEDHAPAMWASMARTFRHDPDVILSPWGETTVDERCFLRGCRDQVTYGTGPWDGDSSCGKNCFHYTVAGMAQAVQTMRRAGYRGIIAIPGIDFANDLSQWLRFAPADPLHQLVAEAHVYNKQTCSTVACFDRQYAPVARKVPLIWGEVGQTDCRAGWIGPAVRWAHAHGVGLVAWTWDAWQGRCEGLIEHYDGTPADAYGRWIRRFYLTLPKPSAL